MSILITGANRGIGQALWLAYQKAGQDVTGTMRTAPVEGYVQLDVADPASQAELGRLWGDRSLDLLICNAGIYPDKGQTLETGYPAEMWANAMATNVTGVFLTVQTMLPALRRAKGAKIAIISSQMASDARAPGGSYIYRASKAAALNLGRNLAKDLQADGISVGIYHPGWVRTDMGGRMADVSVEEAAAGLIARFAALSPVTTGAFEAFDGEAMAY